jgi:WD40 repeat protein
MGYKGRIIKVFLNVKTGACTQKITGHTGHIFCAAVADELLYSGAKDGTIRIWERETGECVSVLDQKSPVTLVAAADLEDIDQIEFSTMEEITKETFLFSTQKEDLLKWDLEHKTFSPWKGHTDTIVSLVITRREDELTLFTGAQDNTIRVWDVKNGQSRVIEHGDTPKILKVMESKLYLYTNNVTISSFSEFYRQSMIQPVM